MRRLFALLTIAALAGGCADPAEPWSDRWLLDEGERYLADPAYRREMLEASLESHANIYARERIANYGLESSGWDTLPEWNPRAVTVDDAIAARLSAGEPLALDAEPLWDGTTPRTMDEWVALGREVFFRYPLRADPYVAHALADASRAEGLARDASGARPGVLVFRDVDGGTSIGLSCALCHTAVRDGELRVGAARRDLEYGAMRLAYHDDTGVPIDEDLRRRVGNWGPGRADITADVTEDPVAIPDLYGLREQTSLTQAGTIRHVGPAALAIRQETQYLHANHQRTRPPRVLALALTYFLYSIEAPAPVALDPSAERGAAHFDAHCARCHGNGAFGGGLVAATEVGTSPALAMGQARGTGYYRAPALLAVRDAAPYLHDGTVPSLDALLSRERFDEGYTGGARGPGPIAGHEYGTGLADDERADLVAFLRTL